MAHATLLLAAILSPVLAMLAIATGKHKGAVRMPGFAWVSRLARRRGAVVRHALPPELQQCSASQRSAIAAWWDTATEDDVLLILQEVPGAADVLAALPPAGIGANPEATVRRALVAAGAVPAPLCPESCFAFRDWSALVQARLILRDGNLAAGVPALHCAFSISPAAAALFGVVPRPLRIFDSLVVTSAADGTVLCGPSQFFDCADF